MVQPETTDPTPPAGATGPASQSLQLFSHDIRAAISDVIGGLRLIDRARLTSEAQIQIDRVQAAADMLAGLVDDALMAAAGETLMERPDGAVYLSDWLVALSGRWAGRASEAGGSFRVGPSADIPNLVRLSQVTLDRIVGNLVSNALRHAPGGAVALSLHGDRGEGLTLTVTDTGPGYPDQVLDLIGRGEGAMPMGRHAGSGLGLRIAADLTREIGGRLAFANRPEGGASARLWLPEHVLDRDALPPSPAPLPDLDGLSILVAEDNLTNQTILRGLLCGMRAEAVFVGDGAAALDVLDSRAFDLALIDIEMPRLSGLQVMEAVRARSDRVAAMPMVALTAYVLRDNREAIYAAGADGIIGKPISSGADFGRAILRYAGRPAGLPEPEDVLAHGAGEGSLLGDKMDVSRFDALLEVAGADRAELLERLHADLCSVRDALDLALGQGDLPEIRAQTHILIAVSGAVGADRLYRLAEVLNIAAKRRRTRDLPALYAPCRADLVDLIAYVAERATGIGLPLPVA
jgi:CheY-like chemotaxis protein